MALFSTASNSNAPVAALGIDFSSAQYGSPIPVGYGQNRLKGNVIWYGDFVATAQQTNAGKGGGSVTSGYSYSASFQYGLCEGQIASFQTIYQGSSNTTAGTLGATTRTGSAGQSAWAHNTGLAALGYSKTAWLALQNFVLGSTPSLPNFNFELGMLLQYNVGGGILDANPSDILNDICTDPDHGIGFPYLGSLTQYSNYCVANSLFLSPVFDQQTTGTQVIDDLMKYTNSNCFFSEGVLKIVPYGDTSVTGNGVTFNPSVTVQYNLVPGNFVVPEYKGDATPAPITVSRKPSADAINIVRVQYKNRPYLYHDMVEVASIDNDVNSTRSRADQSYNYNGIVTAPVARFVAQNLVQRAYYIRNTYKFQLTWQFGLLEPMDIVTLTDANLALVNWPVRITSVKEHDDDTLDIEAEEYPAGVGHSAVYSTQANAGTNLDTNVDPGPVVTPFFFRMPGFLTQVPSFGVGVAGTSAHFGGVVVYTSLDNSHYTEQCTFAGKQTRFGFLTLPTWPGAGVVETMGALIQDSNGNTQQVTALTGDNKTGGSAPAWATTVGLTTTDNHVTWTCRAVKLAAPGAASLAQVASGALAATTYYVKCTWTIAIGGGSVVEETTAGTESSLAVSLNNVLLASRPASPPAGATGWNVYVSNTAGGGSGAETLQASLPIATTAWQEPNTGLVAGVVPPIINTTGLVTLPAVADPDTTDVPTVSLYNSQVLSGGVQADADNFRTLCLVDNELIAYETATPITGGTALSYLRRDAYLSVNAAHGNLAPFVRLDSNVLVLPIDPSLVGTTVYFKFLVFNEFGRTPRSLSSETAYAYVIGTNQEVPDVPATPVGFTAQGVADGIRLTWTNANNAAVAGTSIERSANGTTGWTVVGQTGGAKTNHKDPLFNGETYFYRARARGPLLQAGFSAYTAVVSATARFGMDYTGNGANIMPMSWSLFNINGINVSSGFSRGGLSNSGAAILGFLYLRYTETNAGQAPILDLRSPLDATNSATNIHAQGRKYIFSVYFRKPASNINIGTITALAMNGSGASLGITGLLAPADGQGVGNNGRYSCVLDFTSAGATDFYIRLQSSTTEAQNATWDLQGCMLEVQNGFNTAPSTYAPPGYSILDPSGSNGGQYGSTPPSVPNLTFSYNNATINQIIWSWPAFSVLRPDTNTTAILTGTNTTTGLTNPTTYKTYPFFDELLLAVKFVGIETGDPQGSGNAGNKIMFAAGGSATAAQFMTLLGRVPLSAAGMSCVTTGGGGGGGSGGGTGSCLHPQTRIETENRGWVFAHELRIGDRLFTLDGASKILRRAWREPGEGRWAQVRFEGQDEPLVCTRSEPLYQPDRSMLRAGELRIGDIVAAGGRNLEVSSLMVIRDDEQRICLDVGGDHTFLAWRHGPRLHNTTQKP